MFLYSHLLFHMMIKLFILFAALLSIIGVLAGICIDQNDTIKKAQNYIEALEKDYPEYIDTTSDTDAYSEYYNKIK